MEKTIRRAPGPDAVKADGCREWACYRCRLGSTPQPSSRGRNINGKNRRAMFSHDFKELLSAFNKHRVRYLVGG
jgi:hypothetical protein